MSVEVYWQVPYNAGKAAAATKVRNKISVILFPKDHQKWSYKGWEYIFMPQRWRTTTDIDNRVLVLFAFFQSLIIVR